MNYRKIDIADWNRRTTYEWFRSFSNPCYGVTVDMDVTELVAFAKERGRSFFACMAWIVTEGMNEVDELRMRLLDGEPVVYDRIHPSYTVMTDAGMFVNCRHPMGSSMAEFCALSREAVDALKHGAQRQPEGAYNPDNSWDEIYLTSVPWLSVSGMSHPIPDEPSSQSVPRVCFDRWREENGRKMVHLNITVSHVFVDGYPLCRAFDAIQKKLDNCRALYD